MTASYSLIRYPIRGHKESLGSDLSVVVVVVLVFPCFSKRTDASRDCDSTTQKDAEKNYSLTNYRTLSAF